MVEALQLELNTSYQVQDEMQKKNANFEQENMRLQQENIVLQRENVRLLREVNDIKRDYAYLERRLTRASCKIYNLRTQLHSTTSLGQVIMVIGVLVTVFLLLYYGMGFVDFSMPSPVEDNVPVIERHQY